MGEVGIVAERLTPAQIPDRRALPIAARFVGMVMLVALMACNQTSGTVRGVVTSVEGSLEEIEAFSLLVEGEELRFVSVADGDYAFALSHLREHRVNGDPVLVGWEIMDNVRYALSLADG